jgi:hypothetical protein
MATLTDYKGLQIVDPEPTGEGGLAIQNDLKKLVDWRPKSEYSQSTDPGSGDGASAGYLQGSLWLNTSANPHRLWVCLDPATTPPIWAEVAFDPATYALLAGRAGGQVLNGGTAAGESLTLASTANATKGKILFGSSGYDEVNNRLGIGTNAPTQPLDVRGQGVFTGALTVQGSGITLGSGSSSANLALASGGNNLNLRNTNLGLAVNLDHNGTFNIRKNDGVNTPITQVTVNTSGNMGIGTASPAAKLQVQTGTASAKGVIAKAFSGQTANILEIQDSSGAVQSSFNKDGYFATRRTTEPADSDLAPNELVVWLDSAGTKVWFKAKDGSNVVRKGSVTLS